MMVMLSRTKYYIIALIRMVSPGALTSVRQAVAFPGYLSPFPYYLRPISLFMVD